MVGWFGASQLGWGFAWTGTNISQLIAAEVLEGMDGKQERRASQARFLGIAVLLAGLLVGVVGWRALSNRAGRDARSLLPREAAPPVPLDKETESRIEAFCSDCHGMPLPENYPRFVWRKEVQRGYEFYARSGRADLDPPSVNLTIAYYESRARLEQVFPEPDEADSELGVEFTVEALAAGLDLNSPPAVSYLRWTRLERDGTPVLLACDMRQGTVVAVDLADRTTRHRMLARLNHPSHVEPCDLDGDGAIDLVATDLGSASAVDHDRGRIVWLRRQEESVAYQQIVVASGLGRVCDVQPADVDGDADIDLIVADFGAYRTGAVILLRNVSEDGQPVCFEPEEIDCRPGAIHVPVHDFNRDGHPDFLALVSQEYECVEAFINQGDGQFRLQTLWAGPDPAFGSSGLELTDLDQDGDMDVLYTNGDSFDDKYVKPSHGVQWLENLGGLAFEYHRLIELPGAYRALAGDIDLDGDLDIVAVVWVEPKVRFLNSALKRWVSLVCLEQTSPGKFVCHTMEEDFPWYPTMEMADFDGDGDLDLALGAHSRGPTLRLPHWLAIWWNQGASTEEGALLQGGDRSDTDSG